MFINDAYFRDLNLQFGEHIYLMIETGEGFTGYFHGNYNGDSFVFYNFSVGHEQRIRIVNLQILERVKKM